MFVFGDFNVHHKDWLSYSGVTDRPGELCYNIPISNNLTQMVNFPTRIPGCDCHTCSTIAFPPLGNSDHVDVSVSIEFPSNSQQDALFHCIADDYPCADWDSLHDHLTDVPWEDVFKLDAFATSKEFCQWV